MSSPPERDRKLSLLVETFVCGDEQSSRILGRRFEVRTTAEALGYTRLEERTIYITPLAMLRGVRDDEAIARGLTVHGLGHHLYNAHASGL